MIVMDQKNRNSRVWILRLFIAMPLLFLAVVGGYFIFSNQTIILGEFVLSDADLPPIRSVEDVSINGIDIFPSNHQLQLGRGGYALHATSTRIENFSFVNDEGSFIDFDNGLNLNTTQETIEIIFENFIPRVGRFEEPPTVREHFILKIFYEFEEIEFRVSNQQQFDTEFIFNLSGDHRIHIPIQLSEIVETTSGLRNLTIAIFANPHYNTVNPLAEWYHYCPACVEGLRFSLYSFDIGIVSNFALSVGGDPIEHEGDSAETYLAFSVNPEFLSEHIGGGVFGTTPPSPWTVSQGEEVKIGFGAYNTSYLPSDVQPIDMDGFVIIGLLNWEQVELNGMSYFLESRRVGINEAVEGYFTITAPNEPGYYDFVAFTIASPDEANHYQRGDIAMRFTIRVE